MKKTTFTKKYFFRFIIAVFASVLTRLFFEKILPQIFPYFEKITFKEIIVSFFVTFAILIPLFYKLEFQKSKTNQKQITKNTAIIIVIILWSFSITIFYFDKEFGEKLIGSALAGTIFGLIKTLKYKKQSKQKTTQ